MPTNNGWSLIAAVLFRSDKNVLFTPYTQSGWTTALVVADLPAVLDQLDGILHADLTKFVRLG